MIIIQKHLLRELGFLAAFLLTTSCLLPTSLHSQTIPGVVLDPPVQAGPPQPGQLPNTISAPAMTAADKFDYRVVQSFGLRGFLGAAVGASIGLAHNSPKEWGEGAEGFAKRFGSGFGANISRQTFAFALENALREDSRYFPSEDRTFKKRAWNSVKQVFWTKTDSGGSSFAYARVGSAFGASQLTNAWQPSSTGSFNDGLKRMGIMFGGDFGYNLMQEFFPFTRPKSLRHRH